MGVRHEKVVLTLDDRFTSPMAKAAVETGVLRKELDSLSTNSVQAARTQRVVADSVDRVGISTRRGVRDIDKYSGRLRVLTESLAMVGPAASPVGAAGVGFLGGLANQVSVAVLAAGSAVVAFQGVGDALKAVNEAALEPTTENLAKAADEMGRLSPAARDAVRAMQEIRPLLGDISDAGASGFMPGFVESLESMESRGDDIIRIVGTLNQVLGDLMADGASALASDGWDDFFDFLAEDSAQTLASLGTSLGSFAKGFSELWMAFDPISDGYSDWLEGAAEGFATWAEGLSESERFQDFIEYIFESGPQVTSAFSAMGDAILALFEAASPLGGPVLAALEAVAEAVSTIARSDLGAPIMAGVVALSALNRAMAVTSALSGTGFMGMLSGTAGGKGVDRSRTAIAGMRTDLAALAAGYATAGSRSERETARMNASAQSLKSNLGDVARGAGPAAAGIAGIGVAATGAADGLAVANTATLGLIGAMGGPLGAAAGASIGMLMDLAGANDTAANATDNLTEALARQGNSATQTEYDALLVQYNAAADKVIEMADRLNDPSYTSMGDILLGAKNSIEGMFGASDYEEEFAKMEAAREQMSLLESEARRLAALDLEAQQWNEFAGAVELSTEATRDAISGFTGLGDSVDDAKVSLGEWLADLEAQRTALRDFRDNAVEAGKKGLEEGLIKHLQDLGPEGALRMKELADGTEAEIRRANRAWRGLVAEGDAYVGFIEGIPNDVVTHISQKGMPESLADIESLANKYRLTPDEIATLVALSGVEAAENALANLTRTRTTSVRVTTNGTTLLPSQTRQEDGSVLSFYANGGVRENHVAQIAPAGAWRVWAEPETKGESYIPHAPEKRARSLDIWAETGRILGVQGFANGGLTARGTRGAIDRMGSQGYLDWLEENQRNRATKLELLRQEQRIKDLQKSLNAKGDDRLKGLDRKVAEEELKVARRELKEMDASRAAPTKMNALDRRIFNDVEAEKRRELRGLEKQLDGDGPFGQAIKDATAGIETWQTRLQSSEQALASWEAKADAVADVVMNGFKADLWATSTPSNVWAPGQMQSADPIAALEASTAQAEERFRLMWDLGLQGVSGDAFGSLMTGTNDQIRDLMASGRTGQFVDAFNRNRSVTQMVSATAGQYAYGSQITGALQQVAMDQQSLDALEGLLERTKDSDAKWRERTKDTARELAAAIVTPAARGAY